MLGRAGTGAKMQRDCSGRTQNEARKASIIIKLQWNAGTGWDGYKTAAKLVGTVPEWGKKGKHNYNTATECWDGPGRLQNCSEIGRDGWCRNEARKAPIIIKLQRDARTGWDDYKTAASYVGRALE